MDVRGLGIREQLTLVAGILLAVLPFAANVILLMKRKRIMRVKLWRFRMATAGLVLGLIASFPTPLFFFALELPWNVKGAWLPLTAAWCMPVALVAGLLSIVLLAFGRGKVRWIGIIISLISVTFLYLVMLGLSD